MESCEQVTEHWYVIFTNAKYSNILEPFVHDGFQHCYAMKKSKGEILWHIINPMRSHIQVDFESLEDYPHPRAYAGYNSIILPVTARIDTSRFRGTLGVFNCVEVVKGLLGIKEFWVWTPYQLYKYLRSQNVRANS